MGRPPRDGVAADGVGPAAFRSLAMDRTDVSPLVLDQAPRRIAVFRALYLGDLLCAVPALRALRRRFSEVEVTLIGLPWAAQLVERLPYVDRLEVFPGYPGIREVPYEVDRTRAYFDGARAAGYDLALQMHGDGHISNGFVAGLGARLSLGYRVDADDRLTATLPYDPDEHEVRRWLRLVDLLDAPTDDLRLECPTTPADERRAEALLAGAAGTGPLVGLHPGAKDPGRRWPAARFGALADALVERYGVRIVLSGGSDEREITAAVRRAMTQPALDLAGATDLGAFAAVVKRLDLLITNDTGAAHLSAATRTPSVVLFGPGRPECWAPLDRSLHRVVDARSFAAPAVDPVTALLQLPVDAVLAVCTEGLAGRGWESAQTTGRPLRPEPPSPTPNPYPEASCVG